MAVTTIRTKHQITIPRDIRDKLRLSEGDQVDIREDSGRIIIEPVKMVPADQAWFHTREWQAREREADEDIAAGRVSGKLETVDDLLAHLDALKKQ